MEDVSLKIFFSRGALFVCLLGLCSFNHTFSVSSNEFIYIKDTLNNVSSSDEVAVYLDENSKQEADLLLNLNNPVKEEKSDAKNDNFLLKEKTVNKSGEQKSRDEDEISKYVDESKEVLEENDNFDEEDDDSIKELGDYKEGYTLGDFDKLACPGECPEAGLAVGLGVGLIGVLGLGIIGSSGKIFHTT